MTMPTEVPAARIDENARAALTIRLKSIEGQARGIQRMIDEGRDCQEILDQLVALRAAAHAVSMQALEVFALHCLRESADSPEKIMAQMVSVVAKLTR
jgi:DNA-binding FrmR family transcriptional regulator